VRDRPAKVLLERLERDDDLVPGRKLSTMIVGAPIIAAGTTSASSGTSSGSTTVIGPCSSIACRASSVPT
jgi:hypothetical protein